MTVPEYSNHETSPSIDWLSSDQWDDRKVIVSLGQLSAGLPIPLCDSEIPLFYEILSHEEFRRGIFQLNGDTIRIMVECSCRASSFPSLYESALPFSEEYYTVENFFTHYFVGLVANPKFRWGVRLRRQDCFTDETRIMRDVDFHERTNRTACWTKDPKWMMYPVLLEGRYISGRNADGSDHALPSNHVDYKPWVFHWHEKKKEVFSHHFRSIVCLFLLLTDGSNRRIFS